MDLQDLEELKLPGLNATDISLVGEGIGKMLAVMVLVVCPVVHLIMSYMEAMVTPTMTNSVLVLLEYLAHQDPTGVHEL